MSERPNNQESQKAFFDPKEMARLETAFIKAIIEKNSILAENQEVLMHKEQYGLITEVAESVVRHLNYSGQITHYFNEISQETGLNFDARKATDAYWAMMSNTNNKTPVPLNETVSLLGVIYSVSPENENLTQAVRAKQIAYLNKSINDWVSFEYYLESYYQYLKMAANN